MFLLRNSFLQGIRPLRAKRRSGLLTLTQPIALHLLEHRLYRIKYNSGGDLSTARTHKIQFINSRAGAWVNEGNRSLLDSIFEDLVNESLKGEHIPVDPSHTTKKLWEYRQELFKTGLQTHHYYTRINRLGRQLNFTGKTKQIGAKLLQVGLSTTEMFHERAVIFYQPWLKKKYKKLRRQRCLVTEDPNRKLLFAYDDWEERLPDVAPDKTEFNFAKDFEMYTLLHQPALAYFIIKRKSFKKKKKIVLANFTLKITKPSNRFGKLFSMVKACYFRAKRRKNLPGLLHLLRRFSIMEILDVKKSVIAKNRAIDHENVGKETVSNLIFRRRLLGMY